MLVLSAGVYREVRPELPGAAGGEGTGSPEAGSIPVPSGHARRVPAVRPAIRLGPDPGFSLFFYGQ